MKSRSSATVPIGDRDVRQLAGFRAPAGSESPQATGTDRATQSESGNPRAAISVILLKLNFIFDKTSQQGLQKPES